MESKYNYKNMKNKDSFETELGEHNDKCHMIFRHIEEGAPLYISVEQTLPEDMSDEMYKEDMPLDDMQYVRITLLTEEMMNYDLEMFQMEDRIELLKKYRPYFASFIVSLQDNKIDDIKLLGRNWFLGQFFSVEEFVSDEGILLKGILETSASPINYLEGKLLVFTNRALQEDVLDQINDVYDPHNFTYTASLDIEKTLNDSWGGDLLKTIDIYNIGHGNADYLRGLNHRILYDIGYNYRSFPGYHNGKYLKAVNAIRKFKPSCVILSHWDMDHIIGCAYADQNIFSKKWIAPYLVSSTDNNATANSIRLAHYLKVLGNLCLVDRDQKSKLIATITGAQGIEIKLWLGGGKSVISSKNREGLMIEIYDRNRFYPHVLLTGDVPYQCMPNILSEPIDFMHVPHHCSKMELNKLKGMPSGGECAIISTNRWKSGKVNYDSEHHRELKKIFQKVINTIDNKIINDEANLSIQIDYLKRECHARPKC